MISLTDALLNSSTPILNSLSIHRRTTSSTAPAHHSSKSMPHLKASNEDCKGFTKDGFRSGLEDCKGFSVRRSRRSLFGARHPRQHQEHRRGFEDHHHTRSTTSRAPSRV